VNAPAAIAALVGFALLAARAEAVDFKTRSVSRSGQFVIFCPDTALRGRVTTFVEDVKTDTLRLLGESDRWSRAHGIPVVISLEAAATPAALEAPVALLLRETPEGPMILLNVRIGDDPAAVNLQRHIVRAVLLEFAYRDRKVQGGMPVIEPPWWLVAGAIESFRRQDTGVDSDLFRRLVETNKMPSIGQFLTQHTDDLGTAAQALDSACAMALVQSLLEQSGSAAGLAHLMKLWPELHDDPITALTRAFPGLGEGSAAVQKWWTLKLARFAASDRYKGLSMEDTDKELNTLLDVELVIDKAGTKRTFSLTEFPDFLKIKDARAALAARHDAVIALSARANALFRPVVAGYEQVLAMLIRGKTKDLRTRMANIEVYRGTVLHRMDDIGNYLNWYEATQLGARSDAFEGFLRAAREAEKDTRKPSSTEAIAQYLDALQKEF
jgi:hypothetical protein